ncbi:LysR family transcriptional regulator ArgP [Jiangella endophytica]|uniref:LysR family transcriptional regulator ArgP n=1 Tax=Jiangella endophytica TaxID=1623398 RepID=UPI000E340E3C|nr:LysR family transcriptional regulator ArgP [Jiangella endophytica]
MSVSSASDIDRAQLAAFAAVVEEGSFDAAARRLHVTPSAVSQRVKALEGRLGQVLVRRSRPAGPTEAGRVLLRFAGQVRLLEAEALGALRGGGAAEPRLPVAVNADSLATWFLPALAGLARDHAACFEIHQEDQDHSAALLRDGSVMAAVTADAQAVRGCSVRMLGAMRYVAVASQEFRRRYFPDGLTARALAAAPVLSYNDKDRLQSRFAELLAGPPGTQPPVTVLPSSTGFAEAAALGLAWCMVPVQLAGPYLRDGRLVDLAPGRHLDVALYWQRWRLDSPALAALTASVRSAAAAALAAEVAA